MGAPEVEVAASFTLSDDDQRAIFTKNGIEPIDESNDLAIESAMAIYGHPVWPSGHQVERSMGRNIPFDVASGTLKSRSF